MVPAAELRVYQPIEAFPAEEQAAWERYIVAGGDRRRRARYRQEITGRGLGLLVPSGFDGAYVKVLEGRTHVCPWRNQLRVLAGMLAFREAPPFDGAEAFVPRVRAKRATRELRRIRRRDPGIVASVMQSPWHVPVRWFVLFEDAERRVVERDGRHRLSYLTRTRRAMARAERVVPLLRNTDLGPIADLIVDLHQWLAVFDPRSLLELDYGDLCELMTWDEIDDDHSARDLHEALRALAAQEYPRSAELYQGVLVRSAELRGREATN